MCVVRGTGGEEAQPPRRRHRHGELRDREGARRRDPRRCPTRTSSTVSARPVTPPAWRPRSAPPAADETGALRRRLLVSLVPHGPGRRHGDGPGAPGRLLAVGLAGPGHARSCSGAAGRSTAPPGPTCDTGRRRWTRSSRSGTLAAYGWSLYALLFGTAGEIGMRHAFELTVQRGEGSSYVYFEAAAGRDDVHPRRSLPRVPLQAAGRGGAPCAAGAGRQVGVGAAAGPDGDVESRMPVEALAVGMRFVVRPGEKVATDGRRRVGALGGRRRRW